MKPDPRVLPLEDDDAIARLLRKPFGARDLTDAVAAGLRSWKPRLPERCPGGTRENPL